MRRPVIALSKSLRRRLGYPVGLLAMACVVVSCTGSDDGQELTAVHDLVDRFVEEQARQPVREVDFSSAAVRPLLVRGWHHEAAESRRSTRQVQPSAELLIPLGEPRDTAVEIRCAPLGAVRQGVVLELSVNGKPWTKVPLDRGVQSYDLELGADLLQWGENRLRVDLRAPRPEAVRIDWKSIRFDGPVAQQPPRIDADRDLLFIPFGTWVDYFLKLPSEALLDVGELQMRGAGRLEVVWTGDGQPPRQWVADAKAGAIRVTDSGTETGRLSLFAVGDGADSPSARGAAVFGPRIVSATAAAASVETVSVESLPQGPRPNILIYMIDTLRADHLGCYGYDKETSPHIDRFAADNFLFLNGQANSPWTRPSIASLLTSLLPQTHGVNSKRDRLTESVLTLQEILQDAGYRTGAVVANGNIAGPLGFDQGFDDFEYLSKVTPTQLLATSQDVNRVAFDWLDRHDSQEPFFLYLHTIDPHSPYHPPEAERLRFAPDVDVDYIGSLDFLADIKKNRDRIPEYIEQVRALYDGEIAANDANFGLLLEDLEARGFYDDTLIVVLSDHGEEFFDHGDWLHGKTLYAEMLDTPLIIKMPAGFAAPNRIRQLAQHVDVMPTILDYLGLEAGSQVVQGRSLLPLMRGEDSDWLDRSTAYLDLNARATSLIDGEWKVIQFWDEDGEAFPELYRRSEDLRERRDLAAERSILAQYLVSLRRREDEATMSLDLDSAVKTDVALEQEDIRRNLEALGYLGGD